MGRTPYTTDELKRTGTFRKDKYGKREEQEKLLKSADPEEIDLTPPKCLKDKSVIEAYSNQVRVLRQIGLLQQIDLPQLRSMFMALQEYYKLSDKLLKMDPLDDLQEFDRVSKMQMRYLNAYNQLAKYYYVSPVSRAKLQLDALAIEKGKAEATSIIDKLLAKKRDDSES